MYSSDLPNVVKTESYSVPNSFFIVSYDTLYTYAVTPELDIDSLKRLELSFMGKVGSVQYNIILGVMTDPDDLSTFDSLTTFYCASAGVWTEISYSLSNYTGNGKYIAFLSQKTRGVTSNCFHMDDLLIQIPSNCKRPDSISMMKVNGNSATFTWKPFRIGGRMDYDLVAVLPGVSPNIATPITVSGDSGTITGLRELTEYHFYVRSNCGSGVVSAWRGPYCFKTNQIPAAIPFYSTFQDDSEGWCFANENQANKFFIGSYASHWGDQSLYISNIYGFYDYMGFSRSTAYAYRLLHFTPGVYDLQYYWKCEGNTCKNYGRVFLAPENTIFKAGVNVMGTIYDPTPEGWIPVDNQCLSQNRNWQVMNNRLTITEDVNYYLVVGWVNSVGGINLPLAVDDISVTAVPCYTPVLSVDSVFETSAYVKWFSDVDSVEFMRILNSHDEANAIKLLTV